MTLYSKKKVIAVAGTHGKTTTTAMIAWIFEYLKEMSDVIAGKPKILKGLLERALKNFCP